jgi:hypothetical protein
MKKKYIFVLLMVASVYVISYWFTIPQEMRWIIGPLIRSVYEVPKCTAKIASRWGINNNLSDITEYTISTLRTGMTKQEVEETLRRFGEISVTYRYTFDDKEFLESVRIKICDNPLGDIMLDVRYSKEGLLIKATNSNED